MNPLDSPAKTASRCRVIVADDEPLARERLRTLLSSHATYEVVAEAANGDDLVQAIARHEPDLVFLDIQMPGQNSLEFWSALPRPRPLVVFITAHGEFAVDAFALEAVDYLMKPVSPLRFEEALNRVTRLRHAPAAEPAGQPPRQFAERIVLKHDGEFHFVEVGSIVWVRAEGDFIKVHTDTATHFVRQTLQSLHAVLDPRRFLRIHRSHLVQRDRIAKIYVLQRSDYEVQLIDGTRFRVSRPFLGQLRELLHARAG